jgi:hypothetical protein
MEISGRSERPLSGEYEMTMTKFDRFSIDGGAPIESERKSYVTATVFEGKQAVILAIDNGKDEMTAEVSVENLRWLLDKIMAAQK